MKEYQTAQRKALAQFFRKNQGRKCSMDDLMRELPPEPPISRSAIYRNLDKMVCEGLLEKSWENTERKTVYRYSQSEVCCERIHLRCERCGKVLHMESTSEDAALAALLEKSGFALDESATVLVGVCSGCRERRRDH